VLFKNIGYKKIINIRNNKISLLNNKLPSYIINTFLLIVVLIFFLCTLCHANNLQVLDGDTIKLNGKKIRFFGIDAPELKQQCFDLNGKAWSCGIISKQFLEKIIDNKKVNCLTKSIDLYKREVAICYGGKSGENELNKIMVQQGMALLHKSKIY